MASSSEIARVSITGTLDPAVNAGLPGLFAGVTSVSGDVVMTSNYQDHSIVFPRCTRIGGALNLNARQAATVSFPMLRVVGGRLNIQAMCSVSGRDLSAGFASLETVGAGLIYSGWCGSRWVVHVGDDFELAALRSVAVRTYLGPSVDLTGSSALCHGVPPCTRTRRGRGGSGVCSLHACWMLIGACNPMLCPHPHRGARASFTSASGSSGPSRCRCWSQLAAPSRSSGKGTCSTSRPRA